jgi:lipopolysaccharide export system protein LptA
MRWQKPVRITIAVFVIVFAAVVFVALRRSAPPNEPATTPRIDPDSIAEVRGGTHERWADGTLRFRVEYETSLTFADGRTVLRQAIVTLPDRDGRSARITGGQMEIVTEAGSEGDLSIVKASDGVTLHDDGGLEVTSTEAFYDEKTGMVTVPGEVRFARGRMTGSGVGATYDRGRDVLWLLDRARIDVAADGSAAAVQATAGSAGLARREHYIRLTRDARLTSDGQRIEADDLMIQLTPDDRYVQSMALRGSSRISGAAGGADGLSAQDIDLTYAPEGQTLQQARLMEQARARLGSGPDTRTIAARTIDLGFGPDGATVTSISASTDVVVELPPSADSPARRIAAATLTAGGSSGIETAAFGGGVTYVERQAGGRAAPAEGRTASSRTLDIETEPGLGDVKRADFRGQVRIVDGATHAEGQRAIYDVAASEFEVMPSGDPGPPSMVRDDRVIVNARTIRFNPTTRVLDAETDVRSSLRSGRPTSGTSQAGGTGQLPAILDDDEPVNMAANRLEYDGAAGMGTYSGDARLFQGKTHIQADTIALDDQAGNLTATGRVRTVMFLEEADAATGKTRLVQSTATGDRLVYTDATRVATYTAGPTARAHVVGTQGDVTGDRIDLMLKQDSRELERAEAEGSVVVREGPRTARGARLVYTPADETYVMTGQPVEVEERLPEGCRITEASWLSFQRSAVDMQIRSNRVSPATVRPCPPR